MRELALNGIRVPALLVEERRRGRPEAVDGQNSLLKAHPSERREHAVVRQGPLIGPRARKNKAAGAGLWLHFAQDRDDLQRQWHDVLYAHLHPLGADAPL